MKLTDAEVRELFQRKTARDATSAGECIEPDALVRAAEGTLDGAERDRVAAHIAGCSDCAREFRIARSFEPMQSEARGTLGESRRGSWLPIAASLLLALALPLLVWMAMLRQRDAATIEQLREEVATLENRPPVTVTAPPAIVAEAPKPRIEIDGPIVDLDADVTRGASAPGPVIEVPASASAVTLILHLPQETSAPIDVAVGGHTERVAGGKPRSSITVGLHRSMLAEGTHAIRLRWNGKQTTFPFRVRYP